MVETTQISKSEKRGQALVGKQALLVELFPNEIDRPTTKWLDAQCKRRVIPFIRIGRLIWFSPPAVREAMLNQTIRPRGSRFTPSIAA